MAEVFPQFCSGLDPAKCDASKNCISDDFSSVRNSRILTDSCFEVRVPFTSHGRVVTVSFLPGFLDKNNDLLFRDLKETMSKSGNIVVKETFPISEVTRSVSEVTHSRLLCSGRLAGRRWVTAISTKRLTVEVFIS